MVETCSFASQGTWTQRDGPDSPALRDTLLRYRQHGRNDSGLRARAEALRLKFGAPVAFDNSKFVESLGVLPMVVSISKLDLWERFFNFHLIQVCESWLYFY